MWECKYLELDITKPLVLTLIAVVAGLEGEGAQGKEMITLHAYTRKISFREWLLFQCDMNGLACQKTLHMRYTYSNLAWPTPYQKVWDGQVILVSSPAIPLKNGGGGGGVWVRKAV